MLIMPFSRTPCFLLLAPRVLSLFGLLFVLSCPVFSQPVHPSIQLKQPSPLSSNALDYLQEAEGPAIGLYFSRRASRGDANTRARIEESIQQWEYLLIGLQLPYVMVSDSLFSRSSTRALDILVVPSPELLPDSSLAIIQDFVEDGGGLIASGYIGASKQSRKGDTVIKELAGIKELVPMGGRTGKIRQKLLGGHFIGKNLPIGFEIDLLSSQTAYVAYLDSGVAVGPAVVAGEIQPFTCMVANSFGKGKVVWMGFSPQDVPPADVQQHGYQEIILDALVFASGSSYASVRRWPSGYQSASSFIQLPSSGYQPFSYRTSTDLLLRILAKHSLEATFFVVLQHAQDHPDLLERMADSGELGLVSDSQRPLSGLTEEVQYERLSVSKWLLESEYGQSLSGALPPGYFYDANTLRVLSELDIRYVLSDSRHYQEPVFIEWEHELDYRDSLVVSAEVDSLSQPQDSIRPPVPLVRIYPTLFSYDLDIPLTEDEERRVEAASYQDRWIYRLNDGFDKVHQAGGLFAFGFEPETMGLSEQRAGILDTFVETLHTRDTWKASLREVIDWWEKRDSLSVFLEEVSADKMALRIENKGDEAMLGVSMDIFLPRIEQDMVDVQSENLKVSVVEREDDLYLLQIETLPKGVFKIEWEAPQDAESGDVER